MLLLKPGIMKYFPLFSIAQSIRRTQSFSDSVTRSQYLNSQRSPFSPEFSLRLLPHPIPLPWCLCSSHQWRCPSTLTSSNPKSASPWEFPNLTAYFLDPSLACPAHISFSQFINFCVTDSLNGTIQLLILYTSLFLVVRF